MRLLPGSGILAVARLIKRPTCQARDLPAGGVAQASASSVVRSAQEKVGRNQPCWCGSGKKFKLCHGR